MIVRVNLIQLALIVLPIVTAAQSKQFVTSARSGDSVRQARTDATSLEKTAQPTEPVSDQKADIASGSVHTLPLFGERPKTAAQIGDEVHFLNDCDRNFGSRTEASTFFAERGWDYVKNGQLDTAAYRFNLSWLLNDRNTDAYWGLGVVCYQKNQFPDAIRMLKKGLAVADSNVTLLTDLATVEIKQYQENPKEPMMLVDAESHLQRAVGMNPTDALSFQKLSTVYYLKADYAKAWEYLHQTRLLDPSVLDLDYLGQLMTKQPDPQKVFK